MKKEVQNNVSSAIKEVKTAASSFAKPETQNISFGSRANDTVENVVIKISHTASKANETVQTAKQSSVASVASQEAQTASVSNSSSNGVNVNEAIGSMLNEIAQLLSQLLTTLTGNASEGNVHIGSSSNISSQNAFNSQANTIHGALNQISSLLENIKNSSD